MWAMPCPVRKPIITTSRRNFANVHHDDDHHHHHHHFYCRYCCIYGSSGMDQILSIYILIHSLCVKYPFLMDALCRPIFQQLAFGLKLVISWQLDTGERRLLSCVESVEGPLLTPIRGSLKLHLFVEWPGVVLQTFVFRGPKDNINTRMLQSMVSGILPRLWPQCFCGLWGPCSSWYCHFCIVYCESNARCCRSCGGPRRCGATSECLQKPGT